MAAPAATLPPGPPLPVLLQAFIWLWWPTRFMDWCQRRYGDCFFLRLPGEPIVLVSNPDLVREIFAASTDVLLTGRAHELLKPFGEKSLFVLDHDEHVRARRLMLPSFHGERMHSYTGLMEQVTRREIAGWPRESPFSLYPRLHALTMEVILRTVFGLDDSGDFSRLRELLDRLTRLANNAILLLPWARVELLGRGPWASFLRLKAAIHGALDSLIAQRRADPRLDARTDVLSTLLQARDPGGRGFTDDELHDELITLLLAGHDTTAVSLAWCFELLVRHRETMARLEDALAARDHTFLDAVLRETMRIRPIVPIVARYVAEPLRIGDHVLPTGTLVAPCPYLVHRRDDRYPGSEEFCPERFIGRSPAQHEWIPFGGGTRRCLGASFALHEMRVVVREVLTALRLRAARPAAEGMRRRAVMIMPARGATVVASARR